MSRGAGRRRTTEGTEARNIPNVCSGRFSAWPRPARVAASFPSPHMCQDKRAVFRRGHGLPGSWIGQRLKSRPTGCQARLRGLARRTASRRRPALPPQGTVSTAGPVPAPSRGPISHTQGEGNKVSRRSRRWGFLTLALILTRRGTRGLGCDRSRCAQWQPVGAGRPRDAGWV